MSIGIQNTMWQKVFRKNQAVVSRKIAGELFLVPIKGNLADMQRLFALNASGEFIWQEIDGQKRLEEIRSSLMDNFNVTSEAAETDIHEFITELLREDLASELSDSRDNK